MPDADVLAAAYRRAVRLKADVQDAIETTLAGMDGRDVDVPDDLAATGRGEDRRHGDAWDDAVWAIVNARRAHHED